MCMSSTGKILGVCFDLFVPLGSCSCMENAIRRSHKQPLVLNSKKVFLKHKYFTNPTLLVVVVVGGLSF